MILDKLISNLLTSDKVVVKKIAGKVVLVEHLINYFEKYVAIFESGRMPKVSNIFEVQLMHLLLRKINLLCLYLLTVHGMLNAGR
jgi:hypothetical protein